MTRFALPLILIALVFGPCSKKPPENPHPNNPDRNQSDLRRETVENGIEVTFYPAYGHREGADWLIPIRTWVHEMGSTATRSTQPGKFKEKKKEGKPTTTFVCTSAEAGALKSRLRDFLARDVHKRQVEIQFDSDPDRERYQLGTSNENGLILNDGLIQKELKLPDAKARQLLGSQHSTAWLTYHAVSGLTGKGRIILIEPEGTSVVSDIDDTVKVSDVPAEKRIALRYTFCCGFVAASGMAKIYQSRWGDLPFHYVSGGPWQLYGPLYDYLIYDPGAYPEGTFHFNSFPKNIRSEDTREILKQAVADSLSASMFGSLKNTYSYKVEEITKLMKRFPGRNFILIGDSGEMDPEVYRWFKEHYSKQVKEIWIRDVVNDAVVNPDRLKGMNVIKAEPIICATKSHYNKVSAMIESLNGPEYAKNTLPPCDRQRAARTSCP